MALYLIDKIYGKNGLKLAELDADAKVLLIQDGVYLDVSNLGNKPVCAVKADVEKRGLAGILPKNIKIVDYPEVVDLIVANKVFNFA